MFQKQLRHMCAAGSPVIILGLLPDQISQIIRDRMRRFALTVSMDQRRDAFCLHLSFQAEDLALAQVQGNGGTGSGHNTLENLLHDIYLPRFAAVQENVSSSLHGDDIITVPLRGDIIIVPRQYLGNHSFVKYTFFDILLWSVVHLEMEQRKEVAA
jgi:hypothetical protein